MVINSVELKNYRNYINQFVFMSPKLNVLIGKNAQGKTNLLEGVFLCAIGRSPRTTKDKDLINWRATFSKIILELTSKSSNKKIEVFLFNNQNKAIKINSFAISKIGELMGELNAVYFSPDELKLIKSSPDERRRFMDIDLSQFDKNYFYNLNKYNKILMQRNKLLKTTKDINVLKQTIAVWDEQLAIVGGKIIFERINLIEKLKNYALNIHKFLTNNAEDIKLSYVGLTGNSEHEIAELLLKSYGETVEKDFELGYTSVGPHRDDIKITCNDIDMRSFGSQGQQRTAALSLKLAELEVFNERCGEYPVLLLDDVLSELDEDRQLKLLEKIKNIQTIITCTEFNFDVEHKTFKVQNGTIVEEQNNQQ